jgi:low affinity Fe/Cu permease
VEQPLADDAQHVAVDRERQPRLFTRAAQQITIWAGSPAAALEAVVALLAWVALGIFVGFPHWWEVAATAGLSFVTLLMLIVIQHTQNHDDQAVQLKLDELIRANPNAANEMMRLEDTSHIDMERIRQSFDTEATG